MLQEPQASKQASVAETSAPGDTKFPRFDLPFRDAAPLPAEEDTGEQLSGDVEFRDVRFEYQPGTPVLRGLSFRVPAGSTVALVGSSGSGDLPSFGR